MTMQPTNVKSLFHFIVSQMEKLDKKEITPEEAYSQACLGRVANSLLHYELKRAQLLMDLTGSTIKLREIEGKAFDNTISDTINAGEIEIQ